MGNRDRIVFTSSLASLPLIPRGHKNGIIHSRAKLYGADYDRSHKGQRRPRIEGDTHIDKDCKFDYSHQNNRKGQGLEQEQYNDENDSDGYHAHRLEIFIRNRNQVRCQRPFPYQHRPLVVLIHNLINLFYLFIYLIRRYFI